jgi:hypothetical protein
MHEVTVKNKSLKFSDLGLEPQLRHFVKSVLPAMKAVFYDQFMHWQEKSVPSDELAFAAAIKHAYQPTTRQP